MMRQFECWVIGGRRYLLQPDMTRYDFMLGFNRIIKEL